MAKNNHNERPLRIFEEWCKGCGICIAFCPKGVLVQNHQGKAELVRLEDCIYCRLCELLCPDFAVTVRKKPEAKGSDGEEG
ncbi:MAG TPA: 4Fe-4S dicluster domain-containing protein [Candidatus Coatesbacteria bacterium]|nr:4Fe-4S dicluster domain-containing protein [Candidatus Coatesbacteria bacterium]